MVLPDPQAATFLGSLSDADLGELLEGGRITRWTRGESSGPGGRSPSTTLALLDLSLHRLHAADERRLEFATRTTLTRVASRLVELTDRFGGHGRDGVIEVGLAIDQEELASWSASSLESTARASHAAPARRNRDAAAATDRARSRAPAQTRRESDPISETETRHHRARRSMRSQLNRAHPSDLGQPPGDRAGRAGWPP